jgi:hypothetical protein
MRTAIHLAVSAALIGASGASQATLIDSSGPVAFNGSASVTASQSYPNTPGGTGPLSVTNTNNGATAASVSLGQFNAATGVLTGVDLALVSNRVQTLNGSGYKGNGAAKTASGSGLSTAELSAAGTSLTFTPAINLAGGACSLAAGGTGSISCTWGPTTSSPVATNGSAAVDQANLDSYVGAGSVTASLRTPTLSVTDTQSTNQGQASGSSATYTLGWTGTVAANYTYLLHAAPSFDGASAQNSLTLDFGSVALGSSATLSFDLFNLADPNRVGLDLDSVTGSGDTAILNTNLASFLGLVQGGSTGFLASLDTSTAGLFSAQYVLNLSDSDVGAASSRSTHQLTLNLLGNVTPVPVPAAVWLFGSALMGMGFVRRKPA